MKQIIEFTQFEFNQLNNGPFIYGWLVTKELIRIK